MTITDKVYGKVAIDESVLIELINSKPLQRIKGVNQAGTQLVDPVTFYTRYDHCVGVAILLEKFNASLEEQIAGLLHDVPHTAFSHAIDFVFGSVDQTYHENFLRKIVFDSEIPSILEKYNFDPHRLTDESNFPLLEQLIPALCADRIDYFLRDVVERSGRTSDIDQYLEALTTHRGVFVFKSEAVAKKFGLAFMKQCSQIWNGPKTLLGFELVAKAIKLALEKKIISENDLFGTDKEVYEKLLASGDKQLQEVLAQLTPNVEYIEDPANFDFHSKGKLRYVDPPVLTDGQAIPLSELDPTYAKAIEDHALHINQGHFLKIVS